MACVAVIPARRGEKTIGATLEALRLGNADFVSRVLVVTSRDDPTAAVVRAWVHRDAKVELVESDHAMTAGAARNRGRDAARARLPHASDGLADELLLFVDADCRLEAGGAAAMAGELARRGAAALSARVACCGGAIARARHLLEFKEAASRRPPPPSWLPPSTTLLCRADAFDRAAGFPDLWPGEDLVFSQVLRSFGLAVLRSDTASTLHEHPRGVARMMRHQVRLGATAAIARKRVAMPGSAFAASRVAALLLLPGRLWRLAQWQAGEGAAAMIEAVLLAPLLVAGLAAWTAGFVSESGGARPRTAATAVRETQVA
ncbi:MAG TPA: glycosyltransferase family A protein [Candidatus Binatia bacterium]|jgi:glycosyltransferase involved in cell wall biosynthesis